MNYSYSRINLCFIKINSKFFVLDLVLSLRLIFIILFSITVKVFTQFKNKRLYRLSNVNISFYKS